MLREESKDLQLNPIMSATVERSPRVVEIQSKRSCSRANSTSHGNQRPRRGQERQQLKVKQHIIEDLKPSQPRRFT